MVIWDIFKGKVLLVSNPLGSTGSAGAVSFSNTSDTSFVSAGDLNLRYWTIDERNEDAKRIVTCLQMDARDQYVYCGTTTGDVLKAFNS